MVSREVISISGEAIYINGEAISGHQIKDCRDQLRGAGFMQLSDEDDYESAGEEYAGAAANEYTPRAREGQQGEACTPVTPNAGYTFPTPRGRHREDDFMQSSDEESTLGGLSTNTSVGVANSHVKNAALLNPGETLTARVQRSLGQISATENGTMRGMLGYPNSDGRWGFDPRYHPRRSHDAPSGRDFPQREDVDRDVRPKETRDEYAPPGYLPRMPDSSHP